MVRVEGLVVKIRYSLRNGDEFTANFIGKTPESITEELMATFNISTYHILERTILSEYHAISTDMLFKLFEKHESSYRKQRKKIDNHKISIEKEAKNFNSEVAVPYL